MKLARNVLSAAVVTAGVVALGTVPAQAATDTVQSWACNPGKVCLYIDQEAEQRWEVPQCGWWDVPEIGDRTSAVKTAANAVDLWYGNEFLVQVPPYTQRVLIGYTDNKTTRVFVHC